jgi:hypothetical protein
VTVKAPRLPRIPPQIHHQNTTFCRAFLPKPPAKTGKHHTKKLLQQTSFFRLCPAFFRWDDNGGGYLVLGVWST